MNNYDYPCGSDTADAPWNEADAAECDECGCNEWDGDRCMLCPVTECPNCKSENLDHRTGTCRECDEEWGRLRPISTYIAVHRALSIVTSAAICAERGEVFAGDLDAACLLLRDLKCSAAADERPSNSAGDNNGDLT